MEYSGTRKSSCATSYSAVLAAPRPWSWLIVECDDTQGLTQGYARDGIRIVKLASRVVHSTTLTLYLAELIKNRLFGWRSSCWRSPRAPSACSQATTMSRRRRRAPPPDQRSLAALRITRRVSRGKSCTTATVAPDPHGTTSRPTRARRCGRARTRAASAPAPAPALLAALLSLTPNPTAALSARKT